MNIILVVGASGSGKDSLLRRARAELTGNGEFAFARRYITRPPDDSEDNYYLDELAFRRLEATGFFLSSWRAHGNFYGIAAHLTGPEQPYSTLICSVSRKAVADFERHSPQTATVEISAAPEVLRERLTRRGREHGGDIERRLARAGEPVGARWHIPFDNSGALEQSAEAFNTLLRRLAGTASSHHVLPPQNSFP